MYNTSNPAGTVFMDSAQTTVEMRKLPTVVDEVEQGLYAQRGSSKAQIRHRQASCMRKSIAAKVVHAKDTPQWYVSRPHIHLGYRVNHGYADCVAACFHLDGETVNIWTHIAAFIVGVVSIAQLLGHPLVVHMNWGEYVSVLVGVSTVLNLYIWSVLAHAFHCVSPWHQNNLWCIDIVSIKFVWLAAAILDLYYVVYGWKLTAIPASMIALLFACIAPAAVNYGEVIKRKPRHGLFAFLALLGRFPSKLHYMLAFRPRAVASACWLLLRTGSMLGLIVGSNMSSARSPERPSSQLHPGTAHSALAVSSSWHAPHVSSLKAAALDHGESDGGLRHRPVKKSDAQPQAGLSPLGNDVDVLLPISNEGQGGGGVRGSGRASLGAGAWDIPGLLGDHNVTASGIPGDTIRQVSGLEYDSESGPASIRQGQGRGRGKGRGQGQGLSWYMYETMAWFTDSELDKEGWSSIAAVLGPSAVDGVQGEHSREAAEWSMRSTLVGFIAMIVYSSKLPERWYPGRFDLVGSSHNLWHVLGALSPLIWIWYVAPAVFEWRYGGLDAATAGDGS